jgi:Cu2+-exporting ATPase
MLDTAMKEDELVAYAASIEQYSEHPIARGIVKNAKDKWDVENFRAIPGKGAEGTVKGKNVKAVSPGYLRERKLEPPIPELRNSADRARP